MVVVIFIWFVLVLAIVTHGHQAAVERSERRLRHDLDHRYWHADFATQLRLIRVSIKLLEAGYNV